MWGESAGWSASEPTVMMQENKGEGDSKPELPPLNFETLGNNLSTIDWSSESLIPVSTIYEQSKTTKSRPLSEINSYLSSSKTSVQGEDKLKPILTFEEAELPGPILSLFETCKFNKPTMIQSVSWPVALSGRDVIAIACTGSGKTLAYLLPLLVHISKQPPVTIGQGPVGIVIVPTRELAKQIIYDCVKFGKTFDIRTVCIYGGNGRQFQIKDLEVAPQLIVATPGRLLDFLEASVISLKRCSFVVVDEGDRMMDMGFGPQLKKILSQVRPDRQCFMCTATWPATLSELSSEYMKNPVHLNVGSVEYPLNPNIVQQIKILDSEDKVSTLLETLKPLSEKRVLIFVDTKDSCDLLVEELKNNGITALGLHGQKSTKDRMSALLDFRAGRSLIVIATDLASRGIDIKDLEYVILYDFPRRIEDYVHRIGRTARGSNKGTAITFFTKDNAKSAGTLVKVLEDAGQPVPRDLRKLVRRPKPDGDDKENPRQRRRRSRSHDGYN
jgi:ATP-dependent RNA helicase DDX5/DBP2